MKNPYPRFWTFCSDTPEEPCSSHFKIDLARACRISGWACARKAPVSRTALLRTNSTGGTAGETESNSNQSEAHSTDLSLPDDIWSKPFRNLGPSTLLTKLIRDCLPAWTNHFEVSRTGRDLGGVEETQTTVSQCWIQ